MKILEIKATGFKNCVDNFCLNFIAQSKKTSEDKEYELLEIDDGLYVYSTVGIVGKNASGKTSTLELLDWCYDILGTFRLSEKNSNYHGVYLEILFYENGYIYKYITELDNADTLEDRAVFLNQQLFRKKYYKTKLKQIMTEEWRERADIYGEVPEDFSIVYFVLKKAMIREIFYDLTTDCEQGYPTAFKFMQYGGLDACIMTHVLRIFDDNITALKQMDDNHYLLTYQGEERQYSERELYHFLSSGTTKGINLYILAAFSLKKGFDLIIDEIENHFHKTLVENLVLLYKDKQVNRHNATLYFSTHYCEILDLFNRSDNIWVTHSKGKVEISNMYETYGIRTELLKSKKFYQNAFDTAVNYEALMELKKDLMQ
ncbi:MAG: ATP-binding protein [Lachnospiraceae bacterium]|nr:ATP-binding protein [Muribaculaceae bacterium]MCM1411298.1 ATP-binding protein [Lachnospiraceae bacterium]